MDKMKAYYAGDLSKCPNGWAHIGPCITYSLNGLMSGCNCKQNGTQEWHYSWVGCCEDPCVCFFGCCCPLNCELYSQTIAAAQGIDKSETCCVSCGMCCWAPCCVPCFHAGVRSSMRKKYDLKGTPCCDLCASCCWLPCLICQEARELGYRQAQRPVPWSFMGKDTKNPLGGITNAPTRIIEVVANKTTAAASNVTSKMGK